MSGSGKKGDEPEDEMAGDRHGNKEEERVLSKEEYVSVAQQNASLADSFDKNEQYLEAVDARATALEFAEKAFGEESGECARFYLDYGRAMMKYCSVNAEKEFTDAIVEKMRDDLAGLDSGKITKEQLEATAEENMKDFDEGWQALEIARMLYEEKAGDLLGAATCRVALGDAYLDFMQFDEAAQEYEVAAETRKQKLGDSRATVEALFLLGLVLQNVKDQKAKCIATITEARDCMARLIARVEAGDQTAGDKSTLDELRAILGDLEEKVVEVNDEKTWQERDELEARAEKRRTDGELDDEEGDDFEGMDEGEGAEGAAALEEFIDDNEVEEGDGHGEEDDDAVANELKRQEREAEQGTSNTNAPAEGSSNNNNNGNNKRRKAE